jgi:hypothetical protein
MGERIEPAPVGDKYQPKPAGASASQARPIRRAACPPGQLDRECHLGRPSDGSDLSYLDGGGAGSALHRAGDRRPGDRREKIEEKED